MLGGRELTTDPKSMDSGFELVDNVLSNVALEFRGAPSLLLHGLCLLLLVGRVSHAWGVSHLDEDLRFRVAGMVATFAALVAAALTLLVQALVR